MKTEKEIQKMIDEIKSDERLSYPPANVFSNAPLALIQMGEEAKLHALEWVLDQPLSKFPLTKKQ
jgi:hypothetical protein